LESQRVAPGNSIAAEVMSAGGLGKKKLSAAGLAT
jgi:hypothetical protein